jgi:hypothetical protein
MEPPLCPACRAQLGNAPTETLIQIIAQLATYNQVALRLLAEGHEVIAHVIPVCPGLGSCRNDLHPGRNAHTGETLKVDDLAAEQCGLVCLSAQRRGRSRSRQG